MFWNKRRKKQWRVFEKPYVYLIVVVAAVILVILGFILLKRVLFPLAVSALWTFFLNLLKGWLRSLLSVDS